MAENKSEVDVINHLLQVEKDASVLIEQAVEESAKKIAAAKTEANVRLQKKNAVIQKALEEDFQRQVDLENEKHNQLVNEYKNQLNQKNQNKKKFNSLLKNLLASAK